MEKFKQFKKKLIQYSKSLRRDVYLTGFAKTDRIVTTVEIQFNV